MSAPLGGAYPRGIQTTPMQKAVKVLTVVRVWLADVLVMAAGWIRPLDTSKKSDDEECPGGVQNLASMWDNMSAQQAGHPTGGHDGDTPAAPAPARMFSPELAPGELRQRGPARAPKPRPQYVPE
eukprot:207002_1